MMLIHFCCQGCQEKFFDNPYLFENHAFCAECFNKLDVRAINQGKKKSPFDTVVENARKNREKKELPKVSAEQVSEVFVHPEADAKPYAPSLAKGWSKELQTEFYNGMIDQALDEKNEKLFMALTNQMKELGINVHSKRR